MSFIDAIFSRSVRKQGQSSLPLIALSAWLAIFLSVLLPPSLVTSFAQPAPKELPSEAAPKDIEKLIQRLEDPEQRATLINQLKTLLKAQKGEAEKEKPKISPIDHIYAGLIERLDNILGKTFRSFQDIPRKFREISKKWQMATDKASIAWDLGRLLFALAISIALLLLFRRIISHLLPEIPETVADVPWPKRLGVVIRKWIESALPPGVLLLGGSLLVLLFGLGQVEEGLFLVFLWSVFLVRAIVGGVRAILSPEWPHLRLFPMSDETAGYLSLWARRFVVVGVWGEALTRAAAALDLGSETVGTLASLYRLILLLQAAVLILQNRESVRNLLATEEPKDAGRGIQTIVAAWNIFVARWHFIALPYFIVFFFLWSSESQAGLQFFITSTLFTFAIFAAAYAATRLVQFGVERLFTVSDRLKYLVPGIEQRANRYTPIVTRTLSAIIWVSAIVFSLNAWGIPTIDLIFSRTGMIFLGASAGVVFTAVVAAILIEIARAGTEYFLSGRRDTDGNLILATPQQRTLLPLALSVIKWTVIGLAGIIMLHSIGVNITPVLAGAGILGLAIGFGAQSLVKDVITGVFMLIEDNIAVGDIVKVKDIGGQVEGFTLRSVRLRDYDGNVHVIPNSSIDVVTNFTKEFSRAVFDIGVAYREDVDEVMEVIRQVGEEMQNDPEWGYQILEPVEIAGLDKFGDSALVIRGRFKTQPIKQWGIRREFHRRVKKAFDERGIEIPFPYRTLTWAEPKAGDSEGSEQKGEFPAPPPVEGKEEAPDEKEED